MGSGPMRAAYAHEEIFRELEYREEATAVVGVLESGKFPTQAVVNEIAKKCGVEPEQVALLVAPQPAPQATFKSSHAASKRPAQAAHTGV